MDYNTKNQDDEGPHRRIETPNVNVPPPPNPPRQRSTVWQGTKLAFGGCIVLPILLVVGAVSCFAVIGTGSEEQAEPASPGETRKDPLALGEPLKVGDATWVFQDAKQATELSARFSRTRQGNFVIVNFSFKNNSNEAVSVDETFLTLIDSEGRRSEPDPDGFEYIPNDRALFYENVNPGVTRQGQAIFTVAPNASGFTIEAASTEMFSDNKGFVDTGL